MPPRSPVMDMGLCNWSEIRISYLASDAYAILQAACKAPLKVAYLDDDATVSLELPPTLESDGDYVSNSITLKASEVLLVEGNR